MMCIARNTMVTVVIVDFYVRTIGKAHIVNLPSSASTVVPTKSNSDVIVLLTTVK